MSDGNGRKKAAVCVFQTKLGIVHKQPPVIWNITDVHETHQAVDINTCNHVFLLLRRKKEDSFHESCAL
ncbi:hypothetical protein TNCT_77971 [Trichonephila clavata]|uniref:Uncharacterized protein n=1 Tax=Trichonephila clavata TaxID=2740835 RepID=A0A8X6FS87_TRICU|nr:hypothetical protein TNCT_77971 [Trichonephila clavata]